MPKRRKVSNLLALSLLTLLTERPKYPYEMAAALRQRGKDQSMKINWGSLYTVVQNLEKHGLIEATESVRQGGRPERTIYQITEAGREELLDWVRELISTPEPEQPRFEAGLSVMAIIPPDEVVELLTRRLVALNEQLAQQRATLAKFAETVPRLFLVENEFDLAIREAEAAWVAALRDELTTGSFPELAAWRAWHDTGEIDPEWAALAEGGDSPGQ